MKIKHLLLSAILASSQWIIAQVNEFTWINGQNDSNESAVYGTKGTGSSNNTPGARKGSATWTDQNGDLWLFGGYDLLGKYKSDLWKYHPTTNEWTWVNGPSSNNNTSVIGTQGIPDANNYPGGRYGSCVWVQNGGNYVYLFGGYGYGNVNIGTLQDVWAYEVATNKWVWMKGASGPSQLGLYGTLNTPASNNNPGSRQSAVAFKNSAGDFYMLGGYGYAASGSLGLLSDLWKYTPTTNNWTWVGGMSVTNSLGIYGTMGTPNASNRPGARSGAIAWTDGNNTAWVFGGSGYASAGTSTGYLNDLWKIDLTTNTWTWIKGSNLTNGVADYGTIGVENSNNTPGGRDRAVGVYLQSGNLAFFGGYGNSGIGQGNFGDYWEFNTSTGNWKWQKGTASLFQMGVYGTMGISSPSNIPGSRIESHIWKDGSGNIWLFGGAGEGAVTSGYQSDLWKFIPQCDMPSNPVNTTTSTNLQKCENNTTTLTVTGNSTINWYNGSTSTVAIGSGNSFTTSTLTSGTHTFYAEGANNCGISASRTPITVTVTAVPTLSITSAITGIWCSSVPNTFIATGATTYTWSSSPQTTLSATQGSVITVSSNSSNATLTITGSQNGCSSSLISSYNITAAPSVSVNGGPMGQICPGTTFTLGAGGSGFTNVQWADPSGINNATTTVAMFTAQNTGSVNAFFTYTVTATNSQGCVSSATKNVYIAYEPINPAIVSSSNPLCTSSSAVLTATAQNSDFGYYNWSTSATTSSINVAPTSNTNYSVVITASSGCTVSAITTLSVSSCTGIEEQTINDVALIYPNPTTSEINISVISTDVKSVEILDVTGKVVYHQVINSVQNTIDIKTLSAGLYYVCINKDNLSHYQKIIKQ